MTKFLTVISAAFLLTGCAVDLVSPLPEGPMAFETQKQNVVLRVPAHVMRYVDDYLETVQQQYNRPPSHNPPTYGTDPGTSARVGHNLYVYASPDHFKTVWQGGHLYAPIRRDGDELVVPFFETAQTPVQYYLVVEAKLYKPGASLPYKTLEPHYISDFGQNFTGRLL